MPCSSNDVTPKRHQQTAPSHAEAHAIDLRGTVADKEDEDVEPTAGPRDVGRPLVHSSIIFFIHCRAYICTAFILLPHSISSKTLEEKHSSIITVDNSVNKQGSECA
jgi:hypothetical protein